jgi:hypothetical protein
MVMAYFRALSKNLPWGTDENHEKLKSGQLVSCQKSKKGMYQIKSETLPPQPVSSAWWVKLSMLLLELRTSTGTHLHFYVTWGCTILCNTRFRVSTAMDTWIMVFWLMTPCSLVGDYQCFRGVCCPHLQAEVWSSVFLWHLPDYTVS